MLHCVRLDPARAVCGVGVCDPAGGAGLWVATLVHCRYPTSPPPPSASAVSPTAATLLRSGGRTAGPAGGAGAVGRGVSARHARLHCEQVRVGGWRGSLPAVTQKQSAPPAHYYSEQIFLKFKKFLCFTHIIKQIILD